VEVRPRRIHIHRLIVESIQLPYVTFFVSCSKGTYIRSLCSDAGEKMGCGACMAGLRRLRSGQFHEESVVPIERGEDNETRERLRKSFITIKDLLPGLKAIDADEELSLKLKKGHQPLVENIPGNYITSIDAGDVIKFVASDNRLVALAKMLYSSDRVSLLGSKEQFARIIRVFNIDG
jgi:tRNA pseudouridine55 synthase